MQSAIALERADSPDAVQLITELQNYLSALYPPKNLHGLSVERLVAEDVPFFVLRIDGGAAGCGGIKLFGREFGELKRMYVRPKFRGRNFGRLILDHLAQYALANGITVLRLETGIHQHAALRLYEQAGFYRIAAFGPYSDDGLSLCYEKRLESA